MIALVRTLAGKAGWTMTDSEWRGHGDPLYKNSADPSNTLPGARYVPGSPFYNPVRGSPDIGYAIDSMATQRQVVHDELVDGRSGTLLYGEVYANGNGTGRYWFQGAGHCVGPGGVEIPCGQVPQIASRRATFADAWYGDVRPARGPGGQFTYPAVTFQVLPTYTDCNHRLPQATSPSGLLTASADGSVHTIRPSVAPAVFWGLLTPDGGEAPGDW